jgi:hypothetical protein
MRCGIRQARLQSPNAANSAAPSARSNFPQRSFFATVKTFSPAANDEARFIHRRMRQPKVAQFFRREQRDVRAGEFFAQAQQRGRGHHGVAQPVRSANQDSRADGRLRMADAGSFQSFQRRWTQNQLAGSRRTAISNARFTSRMMSSVERGTPFSRVGISSPTSSRHLPGRRGNKWPCAVRSCSAGQKPPARWRCRNRGRETAARSPPLELWSASRPSSRPVSFIAARAPRRRCAVRKSGSRSVRAGLQQAVERGLFERAIGRGAFEDGHELSEAGVKLEVAEMADGHDAALRAGAGLVRQDFAERREGQNAAAFCHGVIAAVLTAQAIIFADAPEIFLRDGADFSGDFSLPKHIANFAAPRAGAARRARMPARRPRVRAWRRTSAAAPE